MKQYKNWLWGKVLYWLKIRTFDTVTWKGYTVVYIKYTHELGHGWSLWALHFYDSTLSSRDFATHMFSKSKKQVKRKETTSGFLFALTYHRYCSSPPASPSSFNAENPEAFKKLPSQKFPIYQGKYKYTINQMVLFRRVSQLTVMTAPNFL